MTELPLAGGDVHRDFEAEAEVGGLRGGPDHWKVLSWGGRIAGGEARAGAVATIPVAMVLQRGAARIRQVMSRTS